ncbi:MAG: hypothetical protein Q8P67_00925, partial [archaeon]|nr:hypothetical protein [archaeon]
VLSSINPAAQNAAKLKSMLDQHYSEGRKRAPVRQKTDKGKPGADFLLRSLEESTALPRKPQPKKPRSR